MLKVNLSIYWIVIMGLQIKAIFQVMVLVQELKELKLPFIGYYCNIKEFTLFYHDILGCLMKIKVLCLFCPLGH